MDSKYIEALCTAVHEGLTPLSILSDAIEDYGYPQVAGLVRAGWVHKGPWGWSPRYYGPSGPEDPWSVKSLVLGSPVRRLLGPWYWVNSGSLFSVIQGMIYAERDV